jgi:hypothetical protein
LDLEIPGASRLKVGFGNSGRVAPQSWIWKVRVHRTSKLDFENPGASRLEVGLGGPGASRLKVGSEDPGASRLKVGFGRSGRIAPESWIWKIRVHRA